MIEIINGIQAPKLSVDNVDRSLRCRDALGPSFRALAASAEAAGWTADESAIALFLIAVEYMKSREAGRRADSEIQRGNAAVDRLMQGDRHAG